jgi:hypothetical protein
MKNELLASLGRLSDVDLVRRLKSLVAREREATAEVIAHLAELDTREVHLREGFSSLYLYCRDTLGLSEWESYNRIEVARTARRFPVILDLLADGSVHLTAVRLLAPHLRPDNHCDLLASARARRGADSGGRRQAGAEARRADVDCRATVASPAVPSLQGRIAPLELPIRRAGSGRDALGGGSAHVGDGPRNVAPLARPIPASNHDRRRHLEKLRCAQDMLGHAIPSGDEAAVLDRALTSLLVELARRSCVHTPPARARGRSAGTSLPPSNARSGCGTRTLRLHRERRPSVQRAPIVEFHHLDLKALGGEATVETMELRCRRHNDYEGRLWFGKRRRSPELVPEQVRLSVTDSCS